MKDNLNAPPLNPLPMVVWALALPIIAMEVALNLGARGIIGGQMAIGWRSAMEQSYGLWPVYWRDKAGRGEFDAELLLRFVSYPFLHHNLMQTVFAVVILLAMGKFVGEIFRGWAVAIVFLGAAVVGGMAYVSIPAIQAPLMGAYPAVYGLIGAFTFLLWVNLAAVGANKYRAFTMIGFLLAIQLVFGVAFGGNWEWVADMAGFATGFLLSFVVSPGGWGRVREKLRQR